MDKIITKQIKVFEEDDIYKYFCEYRYQPTTILVMEKINLLGEIDRVKGDINLYLSGVVFALSMYALVLSFGSVGVAEWLQIVRANIKLFSIYFVCAILFLGTMPIYFYCKSEIKIKRVGVIDYILMCRKDMK